jgi:hypothetical protein
VLTAFLASEFMLPRSVYFISREQSQYVSVGLDLMVIVRRAWSLVNSD